MSIIGYYDGTAIRVDKPLQMHQKVIVIPIENETDLGESAAGGLHKSANSSFDRTRERCMEKGGS